MLRATSYAGERKIPLVRIVERRGGCSDSIIHEIQCCPSRRADAMVWRAQHDAHEGRSTDTGGPALVCVGERGLRA